MFHLGPLHFECLPETRVGRSGVGVLGTGALLFPDSEEQNKVPPEGRERAPSSRTHQLHERSTHHAFPQQGGGARQSPSGQRGQGISPKQSCFGSCLGIFLKVSVLS